MSKEVFQLVGEMDREDLQTQLALQCAPLLMGIKMSNLLIVPNRNVLDVYERYLYQCGTDLHVRTEDNVFTLPQGRTGYLS